MFGANTGGGLFGANAGGGLFGAKPAGGGLFGASTGGGLFGANTGGGLFGANTGGGLFGGNAGAGLFGAAPAAGGMFGASTGGGLFGAGGGGGGLFGAPAGGGLFGANTGGGLFGANAGGGLFGASTGGGLFGGQAGAAGMGMMGGAAQLQQLQMLAAAGADAYGLGGLVTANYMPPRPVGLILPRSPASRSSSAYLWKAQPESASRLKPTAPSRSTSEGSFTDRSPRSSASFTLPPSAMSHERPFGASTPRSRPQTPTMHEGAVSPSSFLRVSMRPTPPLSPAHGSRAPRDSPHDDAGLGPPAVRLRRPQDYVAPTDTGASSSFAVYSGATTPPSGGGGEAKDGYFAADRDGREASMANLKPIKPNFVRHAPDRTDDENGQEAPPSLIPRLSRGDYFSKPSIEAMSKMSETKLSRIDNLEIGRYGYGSVSWPGLTDVRRIDFDSAVIIDRGSLTPYPDREQPPIGEELNKEAIVTLHVRPTRTDGKAKSAEVLQARLSKISEEFGGKFISYDMEKWIFRVPHFSVVSGRS